MTSDERGFVARAVKMEEKAAGVDSGGTMAVTDIGRWREKKLDTWTSREGQLVRSFSKDRFRGLPFKSRCWVEGTLGSRLLLLLDHISDLDAASFGFCRATRGAGRFLGAGALFSATAPVAVVSGVESSFGGLEGFDDEYLRCRESVEAGDDELMCDDLEADMEQPS
jgi:hypothetical protein